MKQILLVEDEQAHVTLIERTFARHHNKWNLVIARSIVDARKQLALQIPDILFADFLLPDGRGDELLPGAGHDLPYPVILLTSHGNEQIAVEAMKAGALDYVVKSELVFADMPHIAERTLREWGHIVERQRAEQQLMENEVTFRTMLEAASEGIFLVDQSGQIVLVNRYVEKLFDWKRKDILGKSIEVLLPKALHTQYYQLDDTYIEQVTPPSKKKDRDLYAYRKDRSAFPIEVRINPINISGEDLIMCFVVDITERKQLEEQRMYARELEVELKKERELIELKERFTSMISHEFRTPLSVIRASADILRLYSDKLSEDRKLEKLTIVTEEVAHIESMLDDILAFSKGNASKTSFEPQLVELVALCQDTLNRIQLADKNQHKFIFDVNFEAFEILADHRLLEKILTNLLNNAVKYSPSNSTITLNLRIDEKGIIGTVRDEGLGIPQSDLIRLFDPYHRASNTKYVQGTGLGLAIAKQAIEVHGGTIQVESILKEGTSFIFKLPIRD